MLENVIAKYRDNKIVTDLGDRRYNVQDKDNYRYFGDTNYIPTVENTLNNINLPISTTYNIDISSVFDDIDLDRDRTIDALRYTALSSDDSIAVANVVGNTLKVTGTGVGNCTITLTVRDLFGETVSDTFTIDVYNIVWVGVSTSIGAGGQHWLFELNSSDGSILSSFNATEIVFPDSGRMKSMASVDFDKSDNTLWFNDNNPLVGERLFHAKLDGTFLSVADTSGLITRPNGVSADKSDDSLWFISNADNKVYNTNRAVTTVLSSFDFGNEMEGLALDDDGTLWISDLTDRTMYNITKLGVVISSFSVANLIQGPISILCIGVSRWDGTLWFVNNPDRKLYNISRQGELLNTPVELANLTVSLISIRALSVSS